MADFMHDTDTTESKEETTLIDLKLSENAGTEIKGWVITHSGETPKNTYYARLLYKHTWFYMLCTLDVNAWRGSLAKHTFILCMHRLHGYEWGTPGFLEFHAPMLCMQPMYAFALVLRA